jgi:RNA polymerase sigma-70 factor, ECF subfamily
MKNYSGNVNRKRSNVSGKEIVDFEEAYRRYYQKLLVYSIGFTTSQSMSKDILQEFSIVWWENWPEISVRDNPVAWLFLCVKNMSLNAIRDEGVRSERMSDYSDLFPIQTYRNPCSVYDAMFRGLPEVINKLPPVKKKVVRLRMEGLRNGAIARHCGIQEKTVKNHLNEAFKFIRKELKLYIRHRACEHCPVGKFDCYLFILNQMFPGMSDEHFDNF